MPHPRQTAKLPLLALALLAGACTGGPFDASGARAELQAARALWQREGAADYGYTIRRGCYCGPDRMGPVRVEVRGGRTVSVEPLDGRPFTRGAFDGMDTVEELFAAVESVIDAEPDQLAARYDPARGHPVSVEVDYDRRAIDDEGRWDVTDFVALP